MTEGFDEQTLNGLLDLQQALAAQGAADAARRLAAGVADEGHHAQAQAATAAAAAAAAVSAGQANVGQPALVQGVLGAPADATGSTSAAASTSNGAAAGITSAHQQLSYDASNAQQAQHQPQQDYDPDQLVNVPADDDGIAAAVAAAAAAAAADQHASEQAAAGFGKGKKRTSKKRKAATEVEMPALLQHVGGYGQEVAVPQPAISQHQQQQQPDAYADAHALHHVSYGDMPDAGLQDSLRGTRSKRSAYARVSCEPCRKKKSKCILPPGVQPTAATPLEGVNRCSRCVKLNFTCNFRKDPKRKDVTTDPAQIATQRAVHAAAAGLVSHDAVQLAQQGLGAWTEGGDAETLLKGPGPSPKRAKRNNGKAHVRSGDEKGDDSQAGDSMQMLAMLAIQQGQDGETQQAGDAAGLAAAVSSAEGQNTQVEEIIATTTAAPPPPAPFAVATSAAAAPPQDPSQDPNNMQQWIQGIFDSRSSGQE
jgi:Fungal Zn(2)-Cys(6) binuclear cluster domain